MHDISPQTIKSIERKKTRVMVNTLIKRIRDRFELGFGGETKGRNREQFHLLLSEEAIGIKKSSSGSHIDIRRHITSLIRRDFKKSPALFNSPSFLNLIRGQYSEKISFIISRIAQD